MKQANTVKEKLECPKCKNTFMVLKHNKKNRNESCPGCGWDGSFNYV